MGLLGKIGKAVQGLSDERKLAGVPVEARKQHRESLRAQREHEARVESRDDFGVGVPDLDGLVSPFDWHTMRFEKHLLIERATGVIERSEEYYLASPEMISQLGPWAEYLNALVENARAVAPSIPPELQVRADLIRSADPSLVPAPDVRPSISLFSVERTTKTGKPSKFPLRLMLVTGEGRSDISYLADGSPGKARIVLWAGHTSFKIECIRTGADLTVSYITRMSDNSKDRLYDYRTA